MKAHFLLFACCIISAFCRAQMIQTVAGSGAAGYGGEGGPATDAPMILPLGVAIDHAGNIFFSENSYPSVVRKIDAAGIITTVVGTGVPGFSGDGGPATAAQIFNPHGIGFDRAGNLYVVDSASRVRRVDTFGNISTFAGVGGQEGTVEMVVRLQLRS